MKTILLLGGSTQQIIAIKKAHQMGLRTVLCDYLEDNPGQHHADAFYLVSTTDKEAVLRVAEKERIDAVVAYSSDPAAPTAAYIAEKLGLPGLPYSTALDFCEKHRFRSFLKRNGFNYPRSCTFDEYGSIDGGNLSSMRFPLIVKPTDSSGSKGVTIVREQDLLSAAYKEARAYSRNGIVIAEEFIERNHAHVIEAELLVEQGKVVTWGLINSIRDTVSNPLLPAAYSYPLELTDEQKNTVKSEIERLVSASGMASGAFNIEMIIDKAGRLFFLDAGPRNGGNMLPDFVSMISGGDVIASTVALSFGEALGKEVYLDGDAGGSWGLVVLHSSSSGKFVSIKYTEAIKESIRQEYLFVSPGDKVRPFLTCNDLLGLLFLEFCNEEEKRLVMNDLSSHVEVVVD